MSQQFTPRSEHLSRKKKLQRDSNKFRPKDWLQAIGIAILLSIIVRFVVFEPSVVLGPSMEKTMVTGDLVMVNKLIYKIRDPKHGEIIVFHTDKQKDFIKRVIALPGETVEAKNNTVLVNGKAIDEPYLKNTQTLDFTPVTVPPKHVFVLGDNRTNSTDSRNKDVGPVSIDKIVGRADFIYWPISHLQWIW
ncbi:signal peptidase I [Thermoflavimicrobium daqui]|jgi:signal peptidase I|uniref:Signal peptidase I n=1 Tax=Thermoflavimicrobium daqui TaxID=2137476 RepID=A0A364K7A8_9BACL|nr:signal peptidase I [Thermoflavimicrobium daqui]RAL26183.1 signal peptidase I [Thermoflavimicrobium daqui]